jgi:hypothetical protein
VERRLAGCRGRIIAVWGLERIEDRDIIMVALVRSWSALQLSVSCGDYVLSWSLGSRF